MALDFEKIHAEILSQMDFNNMGATAVLMRKLIPDVDDLDAYWEWKKEKREQAREAAVPTKDTFVNKLATVTINANKWVEQIFLLLESPAQPFIPLGHHEGYVYRLRPNPHVLEPTVPVLDDNKDVRPLLFHHILGVNKNVEPGIQSASAGTKRSRRQANFSEESNTSTESDDGNDATGFVFLQLGDLFYIDEPSFRSQASPFELPWKNSGYAVVAVINSNGSLGDIHILYNFRPRDEIDGERYSIQDDALWGNLPGDPKKRAGARIASSLQELTNDARLPTDKWPLDQDFAHEPELVRAVINTTNSVLLRQRVLK